MGSASPSLIARPNGRKMRASGNSKYRVAGAMPKG